MAGSIAPTLHIPYKDWAYEPRNYEHYRENLRAIQRWANDVHCTGAAPEPPLVSSGGGST